jgi:anti-anti-sigma factor
MDQPTEETQMTAPQRPLEVVVAVTEAFDGPSVERWGSLITEAAELQPGRLIVDLSQSPSIDASAIVLLLQVHRRLVCADAQLTLRNPVPRVRRMLGLARVDHVLDVQPAVQGTLSDGGALAEAR